jgi:predicted enzyme related to lactoylglutathione lyase
MPQPIVHLELHTGDLTGARAFYAGACGWEAEAIPVPNGSYLALELGDGLGGGMVGCASRRPLWLPYVEVPDVNEATERARRLGARVVLAPREGPAGWRSVVAARPAGEIAFWERKAPFSR